MDKRAASPALKAPASTRILLLLLLLLVSARFAHADPTPGVPDELRPWQAWVLHGEEYRRCPFLSSAQPRDRNEFICAWPGRLALTVNAQGGHFDQHWQAYADTWIELPGSTDHWPEAVTLNGRAAAVVLHDNAPSLRISEGTYAIAGTFTWPVLPQSLQVPQETGLVDLDVEGQAIAHPERNQSTLVLGRPQTKAEARQTDLRVYRLITDGVPLTLVTEIRLQIAGEAREEVLAKLLPDGFAPVSIDSPLPARLDTDGQLRLQVRPGTYTVTVEARSTDVPTLLAAPFTPGLWPKEEVWSYAANDRLRVTAVESAQPVDPAQARVPDDWRAYPAYRMLKGSTLRIIERTRGLTNEDANQLRLRRNLWLDFDHQGYTVVDQISGTMRQGWRLDADAPLTLMNARLGDTNLLITKGARQGTTGIEVRTPTLNLQTVERLDKTAGRLPATGWDTRFTNVSGVLHLPPGHRLFTTLGEFDAPSAWTAQWRLLDFFIVLVCAVALWRARDLRVGLLALVALGLMHPDQPFMAWMIINAVLAGALVKAVGAGRLHTGLSGYRNLALAVLVLAFIPFAVSQVRLAIYPQLEAPGPVFGPIEARIMQDAPSAPATPAIQSRRLSGVSNPYSLGSLASATQEVVVTAEKKRELPLYAPGTPVQAGPGIPNWQFNTYPFSWSGPVNAEETQRFVIATPAWMFVWRVGGVALLAWLLLTIVGDVFPIARNRFAGLQGGVPGTSSSRAVSIGLSAMVLAASIHGTQANAAATTASRAYGTPAIAAPDSSGTGSISATSRAFATPDPAILTELKNRLEEPPPCVPHCAEVLKASVTTTTDRLDVVLDVAALADVAMGIPYASGRWQLQNASIDGQTFAAVHADTQGTPWISLKTGTHTLRLSGPLTSAESIQIVFPQTPRIIRTSGEGWEFAGINENHLLTGSLQLIRRHTATEHAAAAETALVIAPFVRVKRQLTFGLDWTVTATVERVAPSTGAFTVTIPLLTGESVLTPDFKVRDQQLLLGIGNGVSEVAWESTLAQSEALTLSLPKNDSRTEEWSFQVSPNWNVQFKGLPAVAPEDSDNIAVWTYDFVPHSGETLHVAVHRPESTNGSTLALDRVNTSFEVGKRSTSNDLSFTYRSTQGGRHNITLPRGARVSRVTLDGQPSPVRPENGELPLSLSPGTHTVDISWQSDTGAHPWTGAPPIDLHTPASNITTTLHLGDERWPLWTHGPGVGPTILYWGELLIFIVLAWVIGGRSRHTSIPLRRLDWILLGLGLSTFSWSVLLTFAVWLFALQWRSSAAVSLSRRRFNALQLLLAVLSIVALVGLITAIPHGLLGQPDMSIRSGGVNGAFTWFLDQTTSRLSQPAVLSVPIVVYKFAILLWALWLSLAIIRWLPWAWRAYSADGLWKPAHRKPVSDPETST